MTARYFVLFACIHTGISLNIHTGKNAVADENGMPNLIPASKLINSTGRYVASLKAHLPAHHWVVGFGQEFEKPAPSKESKLFNSAHVSGVNTDESAGSASFFFTDGQKVTISNWRARLGNNIYQLMHAIVYAEAMDIDYVELPPASMYTGHDTKTGQETRKSGRIYSFDGLFDMPAGITVAPRSNRGGLTCYRTHCEGCDFLHEKCTGALKSEYREALVTYLKPLFKPSFVKTCPSNKVQSGLVVHLRGGDVSNSLMGQSRFQPCAFYEVLVNKHQHKQLTLVAEDDKNLCAEQLVERFKGSDVDVKIQRGTLAQDACTLMSAENIAYGLSTFPEALSFMNEKLRKVSVGSLQYIGYNRDAPYGGDRDLTGELKCNKAYDDHAMYDLYDTDGIEKQRLGDEKKEYLLKTPKTAVHLHASCKL